METDFVRSLPTELSTHVRAGCGERGQAWLRTLESTIHDLALHWSIKVGAPFAGIEYNYVAPAVTKGGQNVVIKIAPPWEPVEIFGEASYLAARNGRRCVRLLDQHAEARAILLERIFPGKTLVEHYAGREGDAIDPAIDLLKMGLMPVPENDDRIVCIDNWFESMRQNFANTAFATAYAEKALEIYDRLSKQPGRTFYIHGDYHPGNIVTSSEGSFCVIDPKGWIGHIGYEISVFLNNFYDWQKRKPDVRANVDRAVDKFSDAFDISEVEIRQWAYAGMVLGAWWNFVDMPELYNGEVAKADIWDV